MKIGDHMNGQSIWRNPVRARLDAGQPVFGLTITTPSIEAAAHAATLGFHFLWIEMEHSPITLETLRLMVLASRGLPAAVFARVPVVELWTLEGARAEPIRYFVDCIRNHKPVEGVVSGDFNVNVMQIVEACP